MNRSISGIVAVIAFGVAAWTGLTEASASDYRRSGLLGGMSAAEVMGVPSYPVQAHYGPLDGPPPGCVIRNQRMWDGYRWTWRRLRICH
jgi:hypothetical protein